MGNCSLTPWALPIYSGCDGPVPLPLSVGKYGLKRLQGRQRNNLQTANRLSGAGESKGAQGKEESR